MCLLVRMRVGERRSEHELRKGCPSPRVSGVPSAWRFRLHASFIQSALYHDRFLLVLRWYYNEAQPGSHLQV